MAVLSDLDGDTNKGTAGETNKGTADSIRAENMFLLYTQLDLAKVE